MADKPGGGARIPSPTPEETQARLRLYKLDRFIKTLPSLPDVQGLRLDPARDDVKQFYARVPVESLDDLKLWMGWPNDHVDHAKHWQHLRTVAVPPLLDRRSGDVLADVPPVTIANAEYNLLSGYVDPSLLSNAFWGAIASRLQDRYRNVWVLFASDLVVKDGDTVTISNTQTAFFNRVTMYGSGTVRLESDCKIIASIVEQF